MKILCFVIPAALLGSPAFARDFRPDWHLENIPAGDASIQQCYVFQTTPGVKYTVESTNDLSTWTSQDEHYGIGNEYVVTMREYTPPPPPPPGTPPSNTPASTNVSLRVQPASGAAGGSVVSWPSLDHGGPVIVRITGEMDVAWNSIPIFSNRFAAYNFFFWHPGVAVAPPTENPHLGPKDTAMLAVLEASVPEINLQIAASILQSRNAPLPAPPDPNSKRFWRLKVDADIDTDQDGSPDWAEFEIATRGTGMLVTGVTGDPFDADTNHDGIPDGQQLDADLDGTPDAKDPDVADNTATFPIGPVPRYALFPITNAEPIFWGDPIKISDRGTVLFYGGTWAAGVWTPLNPSSSQVTGAWGRTINDNDMIAGLGDVEIKNFGTPPTTWSKGLCYWRSPSAQPSAMVTNDKNDFGFLTDTITEDGITTSPVLSNDGKMTGIHAHWETTDDGEHY